MSGARPDRAPERLARAGVVAALLLAARPSQGELAPVRLVYTAPARCPGAEDFLAAVRAEVPDLRVAKDGEVARTLTASLFEENEGRLRGELRIEVPGGESSLREVSGESCEEVMGALSLVTALAIEGGLN
ncbi:MAG TPA: hypothetical protein VM694_05280, partial [Polyangium sp.]|nr:hypothetical protein [Polyangium sp.]